MRRRPRSCTPLGTSWCPTLAPLDREPSPSIQNLHGESFTKGPSLPAQSFLRSSSAYVLSSPKSAGFVGHPTTSPSSSDADGLGITEGGRIMLGRKRNVQMDWTNCGRGRAVEPSAKKSAGGQRSPFTAPRKEAKQPETHVDLLVRNLAIVLPPSQNPRNQSPTTPPTTSSAPPQPALTHLQDVVINRTHSHRDPLRDRQQLRQALIREVMQLRAVVCSVPPHIPSSGQLARAHTPIGKEEGGSFTFGDDESVALAEGSDVEEREPRGEWVARVSGASCGEPAGRGAREGGRVKRTSCQSRQA